MQLNRITAFKKAAGRLTACCLFILVAAFSFVSAADAATVLQKSGSQFGTPTVTNGLVKTNLTGTVKYIRHAKYGDSSMSTLLAHKQMTAGGGNFKAFAYSCPGYYVTRVYSDSKGTKLVGVIKVYVKTSDLPNNKCEKIQESSGTPAPTTAKINITHPVPHKQESNNMVTPSAVPSGGVTGIEKDPPTSGGSTPTKPTPTLDEQYEACTSKGASQYFFIKNPSTDKFECVDRGKCYVGANLWYCTGCLEIYDYTGPNPCEENNETSPTGRANYTEDQCGESGDDECALYFEVINPDDSPCPSCHYEMGLDETIEPRQPRRTWGTIRAYAAGPRR